MLWAFECQRQRVSCKSFLLQKVFVVKVFFVQKVWFLCRKGHLVWRLCDQEVNQEAAQDVILCYFGIGVVLWANSGKREVIFFFWFGVTQLQKTKTAFIALPALPNKCSYVSDVEIGWKGECPTERLPHYAPLPHGWTSGQCKSQQKYISTSHDPFDQFQYPKLSINHWFDWFDWFLLLAHPILQCLPVENRVEKALSEGSSISYTIYTFALGSLCAVALLFSNSTTEKSSVLQFCTRPAFGLIGSTK